MDKYNTDEKYFGYHLRYYFGLLDRRRSIQKDLIDMVNVGKSFDAHIRGFPIELPGLNWDIVKEIRDKTYRQLYNIADVLKTKWFIFINDHRELETDIELKPVVTRSNKYKLAYPLAKDGTKPAIQRAKEFADRFGLGKSGEDYMVDTGWGPYYEDMIIVRYDNLDIAEEKTKDYLLVYLDRLKNERITRSRS